MEIEIVFLVEELEFGWELVNDVVCVIVQQWYGFVIVGGDEDLENVVKFLIWDEFDECVGIDYLGVVLECGVYEQVVGFGGFVEIDLWCGEGFCDVVVVLEVGFVVGEDDGFQVGQVYVLFESGVGEK